MSGLLLLWQESGPAAHQISPTGIPGASALGSPALNSTIAPAGLASAQAFGAPALHGTIGAAGIASTTALGEPGLNGQISPAGVENAEALGQPEVGTAPHTIEASGIAGVAAVGQPSVAQAPVVVPQGPPVGSGRRVYFAPRRHYRPDDHRLGQVGGIPARTRFGVPQVTPEVVVNVRARRAREEELLFRRAA